MAVKQYVFLPTIITMVAAGALICTAVYFYVRHQQKAQAQALRQLHVRRVLQQRQAEQQHWRERRLRDVVLLLIERGEVAEGIPLAVQMPGRREVSCRRQVRQLHRNPEREQLEQELRDEAEAALPAEVRATLHMQLSELLAHGRPADAAPGPDIMQMLLDGQEPTQLSASSSESDGEWTDSVPASSLSPLPASSLLPATAATTTTTNVAATAAATMTSLPTTPAPQQQQAVEDAHAMWQEERRAAILRELQVERQRAQRRRRTAEEVYGEGYEYVVNLNNLLYTKRADKAGNELRLLRRAYSYDNVHAATVDEPVVMSPLRRFFASPGSPFRGRKRVAFPAAPPAAAAAATTATMRSCASREPRTSLPRCATSSSSPLRSQRQLLLLQEHQQQQVHTPLRTVDSEHAFAPLAGSHHGVVESVDSTGTDHTPY